MPEKEVVMCEQEINDGKVYLKVAYPYADREEVLLVLW